MDDPWLVGGDFKVIAHDGKRANHSRQDHGSSAFSNMVLDYGFEDARFSSSQYTSTNGRISKRLDRALINAIAADFYRQLTVRHLN